MRYDASTNIQLPLRHNQHVIVLFRALFLALIFEKNKRITTVSIGESEKKSYSHVLYRQMDRMLHFFAGTDGCEGVQKGGVRWSCRAVVAVIVAVI